MGWTHYWKRETELPLTSFAAAVRDCQKVLPLTGIPLAGFEGTNSPIFEDGAIVFNSAGGGCEPFEIHQTEFDRRGRKTFWSFCKTERLPYDLCVQVALVILKHRLGEAIIVESDSEDDEWVRARQFCQQSLGYGTDFRLTTRESTRLFV